jgi:hypothetical protein
MRSWRKKFCICVCVALLSFLGCGGDGDSSTDESDTPPSDSKSVLTGQELANTAVAQWLDVDYSMNNPDGFTDTDFDGDVDTNDAVKFIESVKSLGYNIPETILDGIYNNYYTAQGYDETLGTSPKVDFTFTVDSPVTQEDLKAHDWSGLKVGDLIFTDFDKDFAWDFAGVYLGANSGYTHAVLWAADYYDKVAIVNLDDAVSVFVLDIDYGYCDVRTPAYEAISEY